MQAAYEISIAMPLIYNQHPLDEIVLVSIVHEDGRRIMIVIMPAGKSHSSTPQTRRRHDTAALGSNEDALTNTGGKEPATRGMLHPICAITLHEPQRQGVHAETRDRLRHLASTSHFYLH